MNIESQEDERRAWLVEWIHMLFLLAPMLIIPFGIWLIQYIKDFEHRGGKLNTSGRKHLAPPPDWDRVEFILGDLEEAYRFKIARLGTLEAGVWLRKELIGLIPYLIWRLISTSMTRTRVYLSAFLA